MSNHNTSIIQDLIDFVHRPEDTPVVIEVTGEKNGKVILPIGVMNGVGARTTGTYIAQVLTDHDPTCRVLHMDVNITSPGIETFYFADSSNIQMNLDRIYQEAKKGTISGKQIEEYTIVSKRNPNIYVIPGTRNHLVADQFDDRVLQAMIQATRQNHDYVILSCSPELDNAGLVAALLEADHILLLTTGDLAEIRLLNERLHNLFRPHMASIVDKMSIAIIERDPLFKKAKAHVKTTDLPMVGEIPYIAGALHYKNSGGILRGKEADKYLDSIENMLRRMGLIQKERESPKIAKKAGFLKKWLAKEA